MEHLIKLSSNRPTLKAVVFDFDGTISTLRCGWEKIMEPMMVSMIAGNSSPSQALIDEVRDYIDLSTGIQTIYQMQWLAETVKKYGNSPNLPDDPWWYKAEYNRRLMIPVNERKSHIKESKKCAADFLICGSLDFIAALKEKGIRLYVASGTDDPDVKLEAGILNIKQYFDEIAGAPPGKVSCSKEAVLKNLIETNKLRGDELAVIGDGKVEMALGREFGAITLGIASDEENRYGINNVKRTRLIKAGAHALTGDFREKDEILSWLRLK